MFPVPSVPNVYSSMPVRPEASPRVTRAPTCFDFTLEDVKARLEEDYGEAGIGKDLEPGFEIEKAIAHAAGVVDECLKGGASLESHRLVWLQVIEDLQKSEGSIIKASTESGVGSTTHPPSLGGRRAEQLRWRYVQFVERSAPDAKVLNDAINAYFVCLDESRKQRDELDHLGNPPAPDRSGVAHRQFADARDHIWNQIDKCDRAASICRREALGKLAALLTSREGLYGTGAGASARAGFVSMPAIRR